MQTIPQSLSINESWRICLGEAPDGEDPKCDDRSWSEITVPHTWNADDMFPGKPEQGSYIGPAWYRKRFSLPSNVAKGDRLFLRFEAIANRSEVWVDGAYAGGKNAGFLGYRLDITDALNSEDEHLIAVRADNSYQAGLAPPAKIDWERYGGMYRSAWLEHKGPAYFDFASIRIRTPHIDTQEGRLTVEARVWNTGMPSRDLHVQVDLRDASGTVVSHLRQALTGIRGRRVSCSSELPPVKSPQRWSLDSPYLYELTCSLYEGDALLDEEVHHVGFRTVVWDADRGLLLNDVPTKLCGVNMHQDFPGLGNACPPRFHEREIEMVRDVGMNFIRASHYPRNTRVLDLCDRLGILVLEEQPFWHGALRETNGLGFPAYAREQMVDMVEQHGNHPCIIAWNTVNEVMLTPHVGEAHTRPEERKDRHKLSRREWPYVRSCLETMNNALHEADPDRSTVMVIGGQWRLNEEAGLTECADIVGYNGGAFHSRVEGKAPYDTARAKHPERIHLLSEGVLNREDPPQRGDWEDENTYWKGLARDWSDIYSRDWFCGGSMWVFAAYSAGGTYRCRGMMDMWRLPNEGYHFFRSQWTPEPMVHIACHWSWQVPEGDVREVTVFHNADRVELFLNDRSLGARTPDPGQFPGLPHPPATWQVPFRPGCLRAVIRKGEAEIADVRHTEGDAAALRWRAETEELVGDGQDIAFLVAEIVDDQGHRCYTAAPELTLSITGPARITGPSTLSMRGGLARFAVRSSTGAGTIRVRGMVADLPSAEVQLQATT